MLIKTINRPLAPLVVLLYLLYFYIIAHIHQPTHCASFFIFPYLPPIHIFLMGAEKEGAKVKGEKKPAADAGDEKDDSKVISVYKMNICWCDGCIKTIRRAVKDLDGVESVRPDRADGKLIVTGKVEPAEVKAWLKKKTNKEAEIVSPQPKKGGGAATGGGDKKADDKSEKKKEAEEAKKPPQESTVVLEIRLPSGDYISEIQEIISKIEGLSSVAVPATVEPAKVKPRLEEKTKKQVKTVSPQPEKGGGDKKAEKPPQESTVVLEIRLPSGDYSSEIQEIISKIEGVSRVAVHVAKDLVTVKGTMDVKDLAPYLKEKPKRGVEVVPPNKGKAGGEKKEKGGEATAEKKKKEGDGGKKEEMILKNKNLELQIEKLELQIKKLKLQICDSKVSSKRSHKLQHIVKNLLGLLRLLFMLFWI